MPCYKIDSPGMVAFVCCRGKRETKPCFFCGNPSTSLCDFPRHALDDFRRDIFGSKTCDRPLCNDCRVKIGVDTDICPDHDKQKAIELIFHKH